MLVQTLDVERMSTLEEDNLVSTGSEVVGTDRAICIETTLATWMRIAVRDWDTNATAVTMMIVNANAFANAANATSITMVSSMPLAVIKELAHETHVAGKRHGARPTSLGDGLINIAASDASQKSSGVTINLMHLLLVVAATTRIVLIAASGLDPALARIMFAALATPFTREARRGRLRQQGRKWRPRNSQRGHLGGRRCRCRSVALRGSSIGSAGARIARGGYSGGSGCSGIGIGRGLALRMRMRMRLALRTGSGLGFGLGGGRMHRGVFGGMRCNGALAI